MSIHIKNATVITMDSNNTVLAHTDIGIENDRIAFVGQAPMDFQADQIIDATGYILMPGLVNAHVHTPMTVLRGIDDDSPMSQWLGRMIDIESNRLNDEDVRRGCRLALLEMIRSGITCFADMYSWSPILFEEATNSGIRALIGGQYTPEGPDPFRNRISRVREHFKQWHNSANGRIRESIAIHALYTWNPVDIRAAIDTAQELNAVIQVHAAEDPAQEVRILEQYGKSTVAVFEEWGMFKQPTLAAHCIHLSDTDYSILRTHNVTPVHCPSSNLKLGNGIANVPRMLKEGIHIAIGTDGAASNNNLNLMEEIHLASLLHKGVHADSTVAPAQALLRAATCDGAHALSFDDCGSIIAGKRADMILIDTNAPHMTPLRDPMAAMVYTAQASDIKTVIVDGKLLMHNGEVLVFDEERVLCEARQSAERLG